ncbi:PEGA domain-containing protein [Corallococcus sicarius]|uniref:PEGA domain-containing protein n=1 Tax=Corallococcus sicarius TaxID=2316726 RepID=A0A3A8NE57_9BACT|nr:PEGA domain-containing protein [Corallococcus sicarius]RKH41720.1 PEGA domain-containing protein [Corallococcus sicarius]
MKNQKTWVAVILLGTVAVNTGAYLVVRSRRAAQAPAPSSPVVARVTPPTSPVAAPPTDDANEGLARALRASGLAALEDRDYDKAVKEFTEALNLRREDNGDLVRLLDIATGLRSREQSRTAAVSTPREPSTSRTPPRTRAAKLAAARAQARETQEKPDGAQDAAHGGLLLVTSTPPGLVVKVDGKAVDLTPARVPVSAGSHRVVLAQGDRHLFEETVQVEEDGVRSLNRDLTVELTPTAPLANAPAPAAESRGVSAAGASPAARPQPPSPSPDATPPPEPSVAKAAVAQVAQRGDLEVTSPGLYGEVWINNRPYGFPPLSAQALPAGPARVEVRVNGEVKRRMTVEVEPGRSTRVRVR